MLAEIQRARRGSMVQGHGRRWWLDLAGYAPDALVAIICSRLLRNTSPSSAFPLCAQGKVMTDQWLAQQVLKLMSSSGRYGIVVPSGIATDNGTRAYFDEVSSKGLLSSLFGMVRSHLGSQAFSN